MDDLELAAKSGYPKHIRFKLLQRHAKALCEIFRFKEALVKFQEADKALEDAK